GCSTASATPAGSGCTRPGRGRRRSSASTAPSRPWPWPARTPGSTGWATSPSSAPTSSPTSTTAPAAASASASSSSTPPSSPAAALVPYLPADTESYLAVNVRQILDSTVFKKQLLVPARAAIKDAAGGQLEVVFKDLGLDPFKDIDRLIIASPAAGDTDRGLV